MTPFASADPYHQWDAAYVMGSLSSSERRDYEAHLADCADCRAAVNELSGMPALLALLGPDDVAAMESQTVEPPVPPRILESLLTSVGARRKRSRVVSWSLAVAAVAAVLLAVATFVAVRPIAGEPEPPTAADFEMTHVVPSTFEATFSLTALDWGTRIEMSCTYAASPDEHEDDGDVDTLALVVVARDGTETLLSTWQARTGETAQPSASTALAIDDIGAVKIVEIGTSEVLLQRAL